jgi:flagellar FliJ protein
MAAKGFRLGQVLEHKRRLEEQRQLELQQLVAAQEQAARELQELHACLDAQLTTVSDREHNGSVDAAELEVASRYAAHLEQRIQEQGALLDERSAEVAAGRTALVQALQERRSLELLQERQDAAARIEASRREERAVDELNTARFGMGQG